ncbi:MAG: hypothetical protein V1660_02495 [archaeon]
MKIDYFSITKRAVQWLLLISSIALIITGLGITHYNIIEFITWGKLNKALSFRIHTSIWVPFLIILISHIILASRSKKTY